jgi:hypothetical protein
VPERAKGAGGVIFRPALIEKILAGEKTQTRRPVNGRINSPYRPGCTYAVQPGRGQKAVARIRVLHVHRAKLGDLSPAGALAEGFPDRETFFGYWLGLYGTIDFEQPVWALHFEVVAP